MIEPVTIGKNSYEYGEPVRILAGCYRECTGQVIGVTHTNPKKFEVRVVNTRTVIALTAKQIARLPDY